MLEIFLVDGDAFLDSNGDANDDDSDLFFWEVLENEWGKILRGF